VALRPNCVSVPIWPHSIAPLIPMVFHALPRMELALVGAKRLECGSLLPLCFYPRTTCLEPYRHGVQNTVSVPISASEGFHRRLRQPQIRTNDNLRATQQSGDKTETISLSLYSGPHPDNESVTLFGSFLCAWVQAACTE